MATYKEIIEDIRQKTGKTIHHPCWIAHVKEMHGLTKRQSHNRRDPSKRVKPCPVHWISEIELSLIKFGMIQAIDKKN
ncbi:hypothetical protein HVY04_02875 [Citrobacter freundii]|uniref:hypothetical protein n=1 Tax=Citrobacter freundii TaxID=546 RepID=UPI0015E8EFE3|nr:hypothetical protein [Citrobacter freundii]QMJ02108.1 hypothetical protein HVY06_02875 [Citrobacter freundii]QMJ11177.1 hypothetical protein HVY04_02875 [Citrobacter freundii]